MTTGRINQVSIHNFNAARKSGRREALATANKS